MITINFYEIPKGNQIGYYKKGLGPKMKRVPPFGPKRVVKNILVSHESPIFFLVKCEMADSCVVKCDLHYIVVSRDC